MPCSRPGRSRRSRCTSATTSPAGARRRGALRRDWRARSGRLGRRRGAHLAPQPLPRPLRARPGGAAGPGRRSAARRWRWRRPTAADPGRHGRAGGGRAVRLSRPTSLPLVPQARRSRGSRCSPASAGWIPEPRRLPRGRRLPGPAPGAARWARTQVVREVIESRLVGRGGAAFPTGAEVAGGALPRRAPRYLVCNADESEPGTFKDRVLMEHDPYALVEAMTIAGFATGCERGLPLPPRRVPARHRPPAERHRAAAASAASSATTSWATARASSSSCGAAPGPTSAARRRRSSTRSRGAAASRATSRRSPPRPGLFGQPTVINNVETLVNVLPIVVHGGAGLRRRSAPSARPAPSCSASPATWHGRGSTSVPFGITLRRIARARRAGSRAAATSRRSCWAVRRARFVDSRPARRPAHLRGHARSRRGARLGGGDAVRRHGRPAPDPSPHRALLPRRVVRPVRALPRRHGAPGGAARPPGRRPAARLGRRPRWRCSRSSARRCATPRSAASGRPPRRRSSRPSRASLVRSEEPR